MYRDWKFIDINTDKYEDVPWYKVKAWNLQMEKYRGILVKNYGVKEEDFKQTRMIPILAMYTDADYQGQNLPKLRGIKIGSVNAQNVNEDYLLYVGFKERTGDEKIDNLLDKMNSVYSKIYDGRETAGTVDLLIVDPSGKVSIIDWKFIDINTDKYEDVPWYKVKAWNLQMEKYRGILTKNYGVKAKYKALEKQQRNG